jgi:hypothetical protein
MPGGVIENTVLHTTINYAREPTGGKDPSMQQKLPEEQI